MITVITIKSFKHTNNKTSSKYYRFTFRMTVCDIEHLSIILRYIGFARTAEFKNDYF